MKRSLKILLASLALATCAFGFTACGTNTDNDNSGTNNGGNEQQPGDNNNDNNPTGTKEWTFEAEYTYVDDLVGAGSSNSAKGKNMILKATKASNGHYIGFTHKKDLTITFEITAAKVTTARLKVGLTPAEGMNAISISPETFIVKVNDAAISYKQQNVVDNASNMNSRTFKKYDIGDVQLKEGLNIITLTIGDNDFVNGKAGGPSIDAIYLSTDDDLSWIPEEDNI